MKIRFFALFMIAVLMTCLFTGCRAAESTMESAANAVENKIESVRETLTQSAPAAADAVAAHTSPTAAITAEQAQQIALDHAGFTADQVIRLHAEYEIDRGTPHYDVEFDAGQWEYDYEIHAETGEILSYEKDD